MKVSEPSPSKNPTHSWVVGPMTLSASWLLSLYIDDFPHPHIPIHIQIELSQGPNVSVLGCGGFWVAGSLLFVYLRDVKVS